MTEPRCRHCYKTIEAFNSYDYATRGPSWRHVNTRSSWCRLTTAEPETTGAVLEALGATDAT